MTVSFGATGDVDLTVKALFDGEVLGVTNSTYIVGLDTFEANVTDQFDLQVYVKIHDGIDAETATATLESNLEQWPNAEVQDQASFKEAITSEIDMMLNLIYGLLALAVIIALIGIANTLSLSIHERTREIGLLRAVGATRGQLRTSMRWEAGLISVLGTLVGLGVGLVASWGIVKSMQAFGLTTFVIPYSSLVVIVVIGAVLGVVAAILPARRAARLDVLAAIAHE